MRILNIFVTLAAASSVYVPGAVALWMSSHWLTTFLALASSLTCMGGCIFLQSSFELDCSSAAGKEKKSFSFYNTTPKFNFLINTNKTIYLNTTWK